MNENCGKAPMQTIGRELPNRKLSSDGWTVSSAIQAAPFSTGKT
jgi:hypothetical protein